LAQAASPNPPAALDRPVAQLRALRPHLPLAVAVLLAAGAGLAGAGAFWRIVDLVSPPPPVAAPVVEQRPRVDPLVVAERLAAAEPFGVADDDAGAASDAPDTRLALELRGVIAAKDAKRSRAFIAGSDGEERGYAVGAMLPGGVVLHEVQADRVVLRRGATLETLRLPRDGAPTATPAAGASVSADEVAAAQGDPSRLLELMRVVVATEEGTGRQLGYRVYPGRDPERFVKLGLQPGDMITALNGVALDDPARSMDLIRGLGANDQISLTVERDGTQRLVQVPFSR
jgi:general secretion pathway protein C